MKRSTRRWALGCGCGCGLLLIGAGLLGWGGFAFIRGVINRAERSEQVMAQVQERYGAVGDFQPDPGGAIPPERVAAFVRVRELMAQTRGKTEASLALLSGEDPGETERVPGVMGTLLRWGTGVARVDGARDIIPQVFDFVDARGRALLEAGMGPGEYVYLYAIVYYSWLAKSPADGPSFPLVSNDENGGSESRQGMDEFDVKEGRRDDVLTALNEVQLPMLRRQLAALEADGDVDSPWHDRLAAEIEAMENNRFHIAWRDGLPEHVEASLRPNRRVLESSYSPMCNVLEIIPGMGPGGPAEEEGGGQ